MYSVRMRASERERHISGAERIVDEREIQATAQSLVQRALYHERGKPDFINISIEALEIPVKYVTSLPVTLLRIEDVEGGKNAARKLLTYLGIPVYCIEKGVSLLENGPSGGDSMRGAVLMNMDGERLEPDKQRGIRASRMDITKDAAKELEHTLAEKGLSSYYTRISEALVLATKASRVKGTIAELCWSDDPSYTTGYVASKELGYVRIPHLKHEGDCRGGRVFFVDKIDLASYIHEMEKCPILVNKFGGIQDIPEEIYR